MMSAAIPTRNYYAGLPEKPIAIASGATHADIDQMLRLLGRRDKFEIIVAADDVDASKPDPTTYAMAVEIHDLPLLLL